MRKSPEVRLLGARHFPDRIRHPTFWAGSICARFAEGKAVLATSQHFRKCIKYALHFGSSGSKVASFHSFDGIVSLPQFRCPYVMKRHVLFSDPHDSSLFRWDGRTTQKTPQSHRQPGCVNTALKASTLESVQGNTMQLSTTKSFHAGWGMPTTPQTTWHNSKEPWQPFWSF